MHWQFEHSSGDPILSNTSNGNSLLSNENSNESSILLENVNGPNDENSNSQSELSDISIQLRSYRVKNVGNLFLQH